MTNEIDNSLPVIDQYDALKVWYPNKIVLFQIGAFYEIFGDDAKKCSKILGIKETVKKHQDKLIPMCGFSIKGKTEYIKKLLKFGYSVVIVDEKGKPKEGFDGKKTKFERFIADVMTPSTAYIYEDFSYSLDNSYVASIVKFGKSFAILFVDLSTSEAFFEYCEQHKDAISRKMIMYGCREIVCDFDLNLEIEDYNLAVIKINEFDEIEELDEIDGFFDLVDEEKEAFYRFFAYVKQVNQNIKLSINEVCKRYDNLRVYVPFSTLYSLSIVDKSDTHSSFSLLSVLNKTITPAGNRSLIGMLLNPINSKIEQRHKIIEFFIKNQEIQSVILENLGGIGDVERICFRILNKTEKFDEILTLKHSLIAIKSICGYVFENDIMLNVKNLASCFENFSNSFDLSIFDFSEKITKDQRFAIESFVYDFIKEIKILSKFCGFIDAMISVSLVCFENSWVKPKIVSGNKIYLKNSFHAIFKAKFSEKEIICNDFSSDDFAKNVMITGANMSGKSVFLKQIGIAIFLSQIGFFVPCDEMEIGKVDAIISRIGASDDISKGKSTFYLELEDIAEMVNKSTSRSLCLIDEIGRGTSFEEGFDLSKKIIKYISNSSKPHIICTTHVHKLAEFAEEESGFCNFHMETVEKNGELIFTRKIKQGICKDSFVKNVAKMVNLPKEIWE